MTSSRLAVVGVGVRVCGWGGGEGMMGIDWIVSRDTVIVSMDTGRVV